MKRFLGTISLFCLGACAVPPPLTSATPREPTIQQVLVNAPEVNLFVTNRCPHCSRAEGFLLKEGISYELLNIMTDRAARRRYASLGGGGVPLFEIDTSLVRGFDPQAVRAAVAAIRAKRSASPANFGSR